MHKVSTSTSTYGLPSMDIFLELAQPIYSSSLKFSFDLLFCLIVSVCRCFPLMSHNDCNCIDTFSLLPHDVFISRCSTFHLPGTHTHTRGLSRCDNQSRAQVCRQIWKYLSLNLHKRTRSRSKREGERHRGRVREGEGEGDSRTAARFANKGKAQMEGNLLQMLIN